MAEVDTDEETPRERALRLLRAHGRDAVAFQGLEPGMHAWVDPESDALVHYSDTGRAWVAAGAPLAAVEAQAEVAARFVAAARRAGRRASFVGVEAPAPLGGHGRLLLGEQPVFEPAAWPATLRARRKLREQIRRARKKGVTVRRVSADELAPGAPLRAEVERVAAAWLASRRVEPLGHLVTLELFVEAAEHRYYVAERRGALVAFASLVPIPARGAWLYEDALRRGDAPNGTSELLLDAILADPDHAAEPVCLGLVPLAGAVPRWLRLAKKVAQPLYDFDGLHAFRARLGPTRWEPVWLVHPAGESRLSHLGHVLRALCGGSLARFFWRSLVRHPGVPLFAMALPLVPWTLLLAALAAADAAALLGFSRPVLAAWSAFDTVLAAGLFAVARRPRRRGLALLTLAAGVDAALSLVHLVSTGLGEGPLAAALRLVATLAPLLGCFALAWATSRLPRSEGQRDR